MAWKEHLRRAIRHVGSQPKLAEAIGCSQQKISWLLNTAKKISAEDACAIERVTKGVVKLSQLCPNFQSKSAA